MQEHPPGTPTSPKKRNRLIELGLMKEEEAIPAKHPVSPLSQKFSPPVENGPPERGTSRKDQLELGRQLEKMYQDVFFGERRILQRPHRQYYLLSEFAAGRSWMSTTLRS